jgi:hypothetical protein
MPSTSDKQKRLMAAVANNPEFAKKVGIPQSVGKEFEREDKKMNCGSKRKMAMGGKVGMHKMPYGTMMPGKKHGMKKGGKLAAGGMVSKKSSMYEMAREAEMERDRKPRKRSSMEPEIKEVPWRDYEVAEPSEAVQTMRRQQKELDSRMADMPMMRKGGKVRGCGKAQRGMRNCKMVKMKGA